jgi:hypothetical protein
MEGSYSETHFLQCRRVFEPGSTSNNYISLFHFRCLLFAQLAIVARKPQRSKQEEAGARANCTDIVWPRGAKEARVLVVPWGDDRHGG